MRPRPRPSARRLPKGVPPHMRTRLTAAAVAAVFAAATLVPIIANAAEPVWRDGRWHDDHGNVWIEDRGVWWHPVRQIYYIDGLWRTGAGHYWDNAGGRWVWPYN